MGRSNQPPLLFYRRSMEEQLTYPQALEQLRGAYEREKIQLTVMVSTLQGGAAQQERIIKELKEKLENAQNIVADNVQTILRLQSDLNIRDNPTPHPYTHPIRDLPAYSRVKRSSYA